MNTTNYVNVIIHVPGRALSLFVSRDYGEKNIQEWTDGKHSLYGYDRNPEIDVTARPVRLGKDVGPSAIIHYPENFDE